MDLSEGELVDLLNGVGFFVFVALTIIGTISTVARAGRYARWNVAPPRLLFRDTCLFVGLSIPFVVVFAARVFGISEEARRTIPWIIATLVPAIFGVGVYVYFELFVIGKGIEPDGKKRPFGYRPRGKE